MMVIGSAVLGLLLFVGINVTLVARNALTFPKYWRDRTKEPVAPNAIRLVAFGDSIMQAIGASHPEEGIAGRVASYL
jgi:hypothetical protein